MSADKETFSNLKKIQQQMLFRGFAACEKASVIISVFLVFFVLRTLNEDKGDREKSSNT